jgi:periplasmic protein TonB
MEKENNDKKGWLRRGLFLLGIVAFLFLLGLGLKDLLKGHSQPKRQITTIKLVPDIPPPPPPPPPKEQPKEQPKEAPKAPEPKPVETPPPETLKMEGAAGDEPSNFQAGNVTNDYKGGDIKIGSDGGLKFSWYAGLIKSEIEKALQRNQLLKEGQYKMVVSVWLKPNGDIEKLTVLQSDASPDIEQALKTALNSLQSIKKAPPEGMPQPVKLRITARKLG